EARKQYASALASKSAPDDSLTKTVADLQAKIDSRKDQLAAAKPKPTADEKAMLLAKSIEQKQTDLTAAEKFAAEAEAALFKSQSELMTLDLKHDTAAKAEAARDRFKSRV